MEDQAPVDPSGVPHQLNEDLRKSIIKEIERVNQERIDRNSTPHVVTQELCGRIKELDEEGLSTADITDIMPYSSRRTTLYHLNDNCSHDESRVVTYDECGWMRVYSHNGAPTQTLAVLYDLNEKTVRKHLRGDCRHEDGINPVSKEVMYGNSRSAGTEVSSICEECGSEFSHKRWHDRTTCSEECKMQYVTDKRRKSSSD